jgi:DNA-binding transcriptional LysR family regulator
MPDAFTLDQLRTFVAVHEAGNFSAAARKLRRAQSAVSTAMANLEEQLGVSLWNRATRIATLTEHGEAMLAAAKRLLAEADALGRLAGDLNGGVEAEVCLCIDALFPVDALVELSASFARAFPHVDLRIDTQTMSDVAARVVGGTATLGVVSPLGVRPGLERLPLSTIRMIPVVSPRHPLARCQGRLETRAFAGHVQLVLAERQDAGVPDQAVLSPRTWRITDLQTKRELILGGVGWGNLPLHMVRDDLARKKLVIIRPAAWRDDEHTLGLSAIYRRDTAWVPAHRWMLEALRAVCVRATTPASPAPSAAPTQPAPFAPPVRPAPPARASRVGRRRG